MAILSFSKVSKAFINEEIFSDVSFLLDKNDKVGLIGNNGSGKSTLLKIISGELEADQGIVNKDKDLKIAYLDQSPQFTEDQTIIDVCLEEYRDIIAMEANLEKLSVQISQTPGQGQEVLMDQYSNLLERFEKLNGYEYRSKVRGVLIGLGFEENEFHTRVSSLSGGQKSRLHMASLLLKSPDLLLLDEPTNHLDMEATSFLESFLKNYNGAMIIVSHDRYFLDKIINRTFHLDYKRLHIYECGYREFTRRREERMAALAKKYEKQQAQIKKQEEIIERFSNYGRDRYKKQAESRKKQLEKMELVEEPHSDSSAFNLTFSPLVQSGIDVLTLEDISKSFGGRQVLSNISFDVKRGDRIGIIGANGVGKTSLLKMIIGHIEPDHGQIHIGSNVIYAYYDQEQDNLDNTNLLVEEIIDSEDSMTISKARNYLGAFNFKGDDVYKLVGELSGGEKGRLSLLKLMLEMPNLLLMDEPTNHLDIESKEILEKALEDYEGTFVAVSHDRYFLNKVANKIILIEKDGASIYYGNYDYYIDKTSIEEDEFEENGPSKTSIDKEKKKINRSKKEIRQTKAKANDLEKKISHLEDKLAKEKEKLYRPEIYNDYEKALEVNNEIGDIENKIENYTDQWFIISEKLEDMD